MRPVKDHRTPQTLGAPVGMENCDSLPVFIDPVQGIFISYWHVSWKERLLILFGRNVRLYVVGRVHCPLHLDTEKV